MAVIDCRLRRRVADMLRRADACVLELNLDAKRAVLYKFVRQPGHQRSRDIGFLFSLVRSLGPGERPELELHLKDCSAASC